MPNPTKDSDRLILLSFFNELNKQYRDYLTTFETLTNSISLEDLNKILPRICQQFIDGHLFEVSLVVFLQNPQSSHTSDLINGYQQLRERCEDLVDFDDRQKVKKIQDICTLLFKGENAEALRSMVNEWMRSQDAPCMRSAQIAYTNFFTQYAKQAVLEKKDIEKIILEWKGALSRLETCKSILQLEEKAIEASGELDERPVTPNNKGLSPITSPLSLAAKRRISGDFRRVSGTSSPGSTNDSSPALYDAHAKINSQNEIIAQLRKEGKAFDNLRNRDHIQQSKIAGLETTIAEKDEQIRQLQEESLAHSHHITVLEREQTHRETQSIKEKKELNQQIEDSQVSLQRLKQQLHHKTMALSKEKDNQVTLQEDNKDLKYWNEKTSRTIEKMNKSLANMVPTLDISSDSNEYDTLYKRLSEIKKLVAAGNAMPDVQQQLSESNQTIQRLEKKLADSKAPLKMKHDASADPLEKLAEQLDSLLDNLPSVSHAVMEKVYYQLASQFLQYQKELDKGARLDRDIQKSLDYCQERFSLLKGCLPPVEKENRFDSYSALPWLPKETTHARYIPFNFFGCRETFQWRAHQLVVTPEENQQSTPQVQLALSQSTPILKKPEIYSIAKEADTIDIQLILELVQLILAHTAQDSLLMITIKGDLKYHQALFMYLKAMQQISGIHSNLQIDSCPSSQYSAQEEAAALQNIQKILFGELSLRVTPPLGSMPPPLRGMPVSDTFSPYLFA